MLQFARPSGLVVRPVPEGARALYEESRVTEYYRSFILTDEIRKDAIRAVVSRTGLPKRVVYDAVVAAKTP